MGKLYVPGTSGGTANITPYMEVNGLTKKVKRIYWEKDGKTVLIWPTEEVKGSYLKHFTVNRYATDFDVILQGAGEGSYLNYFKLDTPTQTFGVVLEG
jgi:hypothetical protein